MVRRAYKERDSTRVCGGDRKRESVAAERLCGCGERAREDIKKAGAAETGFEPGATCT